MARHTGFWSYLLYDYDTRRHHEVVDAAEQAQNIADQAVARSWSLEQRVDQLNREVVMLRTVVAVLAQTLKDTDVIDDRLLDARLEAALDAAFAPPESTRAETEPAGPPMVTCRRCGQQVLASTTTMTADGAKCDRCPVPAR